MLERRCCCSDDPALFDVSACSTKRATVPGVSRSIHVRLDDAADAALEVLRAGGLTDSEAVRVALREAGQRRRMRSALAAEVDELANDPEDVIEARQVRELMAELAPQTTDCASWSEARSSACPRPAARAGMRSREPDMRSSCKPTSCWD